MKMPLANLAFYEKSFNISTQSDAFVNFTRTLANYYAAYYVDWAKVLADAKRHESAFALLSPLCGTRVAEKAALDLFMHHPEAIRALLILIACRGKVSIATNDVDGAMMHYTFAPVGSTESTRRVEARPLTELSNAQPTLSASGSLWPMISNMNDRCR